LIGTRAIEFAPATSDHDRDRDDRPRTLTLCIYQKQ